MRARTAPQAEFFDLSDIFWASNDVLPVLAGEYAKFVGFEEERGDVFAGYRMLSKCLELREVVLCEDQVDFRDLRTFGSQLCSFEAKVGGTIAVSEEE